MDSIDRSMDLSPFSLLNNYKIREQRSKKNEITDFTVQEFITLNVIDSVGAVAPYQLEWLWGKKSRKKLNSLSAKGYMAKILLSGRKDLAVYTLQNQNNIDSLLRKLVFAQLYTKFREVVSVEASIKCTRPFSGVINIGKVFPVLVLRKGDSTSILPDILKNVPRLLVVMENFKEIKLEVPFRVATDFSLMQSIDKAFFKPDGTPEYYCAEKICRKY
ncbi:MAG: hypothetical protein K9L17_08165 [Clostridiales bacterium]|nr:hypothetical protein [Clostridiales bacterium]MCF8022649.1 hypothetical protein [Clostridiales bacterium]